jgi:hypothetical protein
VAATQSAAADAACAPDVTVTVTAAAQTAAAATANVAAVQTAAAATGSTAGADFGSCSTPSIIFAAGLDNRKETAFEPKDLKSFNHGSAQNVSLQLLFILDH